MLKSEVERTRAVLSNSKTSYMRVAWSPHVVRFSEELQLVDILDAFGLVYGTVSSATNAQTKWFGKASIDATTKEMGAPGGELVYKIKWEDAPRTRLALKVPKMKEFLQNQLKHMPKSKDFLDVFGEEDLTAMGTYDGTIAAYKEAANINPVITMSDGGIDIVGMTKSDIMPFVNARKMDKTCNLWLRATDAEADTRYLIAQHAKDKSWAERSIAVSKATIESRCNEAIAKNRELVHKEIAQIDKLQAQEIAQIDKLKAQEIAQIDKLQAQLIAAEKMGMAEEAVGIKRKLRDAILA